MYIHGSENEATISSASEITYKRIDCFYRKDICASVDTNLMLKI